jgi:hypothetical protein
MFHEVIHGRGPSGVERQRQAQVLVCPDSAQIIPASLF